MSDDIQDDLTDEEKALLKREIQYEIQQKRDREELQVILPKIFVVGGVISLVVMLLLLSPSMSSGMEWLTFLCGIPGGLLILIGAGTLWEMQRSQKVKRSDKSKRKRSDF